MRDNFMVQHLIEPVDLTLEGPATQRVLTGARASVHALQLEKRALRERPGYSWRSASIGSMRAARRAG